MCNSFEFHCNVVGFLDFQLSLETVIIVTLFVTKYRSLLTIIECITCYYL